MEHVAQTRLQTHSDSGYATDRMGALSQPCDLFGNTAHKLSIWIRDAVRFV